MNVLSVESSGRKIIAKIFTPYLKNFYGHEINVYGDIFIHLKGFLGEKKKNFEINVENHWFKFMRFRKGTAFHSLKMNMQLGFLDITHFAMFPSSKITIYTTGENLFPTVSNSL